MNPEIVSDHPFVLIVDDNIKNIQVLGGFLQNEGIMIEFALDGKSALIWLEKKKFDLILLDIMMPGIDGYEVCKQIKKNPLINDIPIIFITAVTDSDSVVKGFDSGAVDYVTKPFIQRELLVRVRTHLEIKQTKENLIKSLIQIKERNRDISESIDYASNIQNAVVNNSEYNLEYLPGHFILNLPKDILSGDFYWFRQVGKNLVIAVMDCTGHGVPGALMSILGITLLNEIVVNDRTVQPDRILESLRSRIIRALGQKNGINYIKDGIEGSVICYNAGINRLQYSGSYNPLILIRNNEIISIKADRIPIGFYEVTGNFTLHEINIEKNDTIYLFSDGIVDQFGGPKTKRFMFKHLKEILLSIHGKPMSMQKEILTEELNRWKGDSVQTDDIMVLGIRF